MQAVNQSTLISDLAKKLYQEERSLPELNGWFLAKEAMLQVEKSHPDLSEERRAVLGLESIIDTLPLSLSEYAVFAGTQRDAFAPTYALINPAFKVETFSGYCDPNAVFDDIQPNDRIDQARIQRARAQAADTDYVRELSGVYSQFSPYTDEVVFFVEQVTGHLIPDFRPALRDGVYALHERIEAKANLAESSGQNDQAENLRLFGQALMCAVRLAERYARIARDQRVNASGERASQLDHLIDMLEHVPAYGARNLREAIQSYMLLWQVMCVEQAPNPFAFSVGNADSIFEPYRAMENTTREETAAWFKHFLVFFNVGSRSWAISQNILLGGRDMKGDDRTNETTYALLDAYYDMNLPQPILSVRLHQNTPDALYRAMGWFFCTPGMPTPSLFNDDTILPMLTRYGIDPNDAVEYAIAGCQEPLIMGKENGNTTNSWLNLAKVLELVLCHGESAVTGRTLIPLEKPDATELLSSVRERFYRLLESVLSEMAEAANRATHAISHLRVPFLSTFMGGADTGWDTRDTAHQGTRYNASGCLIHGLSVVADSFVAVDHLLREQPEDAERLLSALRDNYAHDQSIHEFVKSCPKFGNNLDEPDREAIEIAKRVSNCVRQLRNNWGQPFRADWSTPTTHLLYGYWVGALPDGRSARDMLSYGVDPLYGDAYQGLGFRMLSALKLPYMEFNGGYASHLGVDPKYFRSDTMDEKGIEMKRRVIAPLFFNPQNENDSPFYLYMNVTTPEILRRVLANPKKYAPSGVYIMRIHGTFVNFLDLSPAIQEDIITRLDTHASRMEDA